MKVLNTIDSCQTCPLGHTSPACALHEIKRPAGSVLVEQGVPPPHVWLIKQGTVLLSAVDPGGEEVLCAIRGTGSLVGLEAVRGEPSPLAAWALSDVVLCGANTETFREWLGDSTTPAAALLDLALAEATRRGEERMALSGRSVSRLARFLVERRRVEGQDRPLRIRQRVLARMLGMRAETLSRAVAKLREAGAIADGPGLRVADVGELERLAIAVGHETAHA